VKGTRFSQEKVIGILKEAECKISTIVTDIIKNFQLGKLRREKK
jgi:hypothetical protein